MRGLPVSLLRDAGGFFMAASRTNLDSMAANLLFIKAISLSCSKTMACNMAIVSGMAIVSKPLTLVVVGSYASDTTLALAKSFKTAGLSLVSPTASSTTLTNGALPGFNRVVARSDELGRAAGQYIQKALKSKRVLLLDDTSADGLDVSRNVAAYLKATKIPVVGQKSTLEKVNFTALVGEIKALKPDFIFMGFSSVQSSALLLGKLRRSGVSTPVMGTSVLADSQFRSLAGSDTKGVYYASYVAPVEAYASPLFPQFNQQF